MVGRRPPPAWQLEPGSGDRWVLSGSVGLRTAAAILARGEAAFGGMGRVVVDLSGVTEADSAGLAVLVEWTRSACASGRSIAFQDLPARLADLARIGGLAELLPVES